MALHFPAYANAMAGNSRIAIETIDRILVGTYSQFTCAMLILAHTQEGDLARAKKATQFALQRYPDLTTDFVTTHLARGAELEHLMAVLRTAGIPDET